jgi:HD-like signal output (HDOD) protein
MNGLKPLSLSDLKTLAEKMERPPEVAIQLNRLLHKPNVNAEELADTIKMDSRMTAQVLRLCNSAAYGLRREITTVKEAVAMLGTNALVSMVYAILAKVALDKDVSGYGLEKGQLFRNALTGALYSRYLASRMRGDEPVDGEQAFTGAILRDIGKVLLGDYVGDAYGDIEHEAMERQISFPQAEKEILGVSHLEAGHYMAKVWGLPDMLVKSIRYKTEPSAMPTNDPFRKQHFPVVAAVHLGDAFVRMNGVGIGVDGLMYLLDDAALRLLPESQTDAGMEGLMAGLINLHPQVDDMLAFMEEAEA